MPIYEYRCRVCKDKFEILLGFGDNDKGIICPRCKSSEVEKCFSVFGFRSSGSFRSSSTSSCSSCKATSCATCR